ncbi:MAG: hypothetical protein KAH86_00480, partial [Methanosarcinales archaeon]|nr:hypothetical protein [Methanosarcinales archaeon]
FFILRFYRKNDSDLESYLIVWNHSIHLKFIHFVNSCMPIKWTKESWEKLCNVGRIDTPN